MIKIEKWNISQWPNDKSDILEIESKCFDDSLAMDEDEVYESLSEGIVVVARDDNKIVGITYANDYDKINSEWFEGYFNPLDYPKYIKNKSLYITSTAILPEYRNKEIAIQIRILLINICRELSYKYIIGHAHKGSMCKIYKIFGGTIVASFPKWYGSRQTHYLCELDIENLFFNYVPKIKQKYDYDCALASLKCVIQSIGIELEENKYISLDISKEIGTSHESILLWLKTQFLTQGLYYHSKYNSTIDDLRNCLIVSDNPIVNYLDSDRIGHYSVIIGVSPIYVFIRDVWDGRIIKIKTDNFEKRWKSKMYGYKWLLFMTKVV